MTLAEAAPPANFASWNSRFLGVSVAGDIACSRIRPCHSAGTVIAHVDSLCAIRTERGQESPANWGPKKTKTKDAIQKQKMSIWGG